MMLAALALIAAPLPDGVATSGARALRGLYAQQAFGHFAINTDLDALRERCGARLRIEGGALQWQGKHRTYRVGERVAVWEDRPALTSDAIACSARLTLRRTVTIGAGADAIDRAGWGAPPHRCDRRRRCSTSTIGGVTARCYDMGEGLTGSVMCLGDGNDLSQGLVLGHSQYSDDGSIPDSGWEMDRVPPDIAIDPAVFRRP